MSLIRRCAGVCCVGFVSAIMLLGATAPTATAQPNFLEEGELAPDILQSEELQIQPENPTAPAQARPRTSENPLSALGACVAAKGELDVLLMMDETESLIHQVKDGNIDPKTPGSDASHNRVPAAQSFVNQLLTKHNDEDVNVRIRVAGFGQEYKNGATDPAYGEWVELDDQSVSEVKSTIAGFSERTDEQYTNYAHAFEGAYQDFARSGAEDSCKMLLTFTDGALTAQEGHEVAQEAICRPNGITDKFRAAGITNVGIGLSDPKNPSDFDLFAGITEATGTECGTLEPNGVFFPADSVGGLFASFHQALGDGGSFSEETSAGQPFEFVLDKSIDSVRFIVLAKDDLGDNAKLNLVAPDGSKIVLEGEKSGTVGGAKVSWSEISEPVQKVEGEMTLENPEDWAGPWQLMFEGFHEDYADHRVFNSVKIQPDLQIQVAGPDGPATGSIHARSNNELSVRLVGRDGKPRALEGEAELDLSFVPSGEGDTVSLLDGEDVSEGKEAKVQLNALDKLPATGTLHASVGIVTAGSQGAQGTVLEPVTSDLDISVSRVDMPEVPGALNFTMESPEITTSIPVKGPGKVWIPGETTLDTEVLPEGIDAIDVSSEYNSVDSALELAENEEASLPLKISVAQLRDGVVSGTVPVQVARTDGSQETIVPVAARGNLAVPLNKTAFTLAFIAALLLGLLIPLALLYLVRYLTARIPKQYFGAQRIPLSFEGSVVRFNGAHAPTIDLDEASRNEIIHDGRSAHVLGHTLRVRSFQINPFAESSVIVGTTPSVAASGAQQGQQAKLPLAVQGHWFIAGVQDQLELIVMPRLPIDHAAAQRLEQEIIEKAPQLAARIQQVLDEQRAQQPPASPAGTVIPGTQAPAPTQQDPWATPSNNQNGPDWGTPPQWN